MLEPGPTVVERDPPGQEPGGQPEVERTADVAPAQGHEEPGSRQLGQRRGRLLGRHGRLGQVAAAEHHDHVALAALDQLRDVGHVGVLDRASAQRGDQPPGRGGLLARHRADGGVGGAGQALVA